MHICWLVVFSISKKEWMNSQNILALFNSECHKWTSAKYFKMSRQAAGDISKGLDDSSSREFSAGRPWNYSQRNSVHWCDLRFCKWFSKSLQKNYLKSNDGTSFKGVCNECIWSFQLYMLYLKSHSRSIVKSSAKNSDISPNAGHFRSSLPLSILRSNN